MIDLGTAALAAQALNNAVSAVDRFYGLYKASRNEAVEGSVLRANPKAEALEYIGPGGDRREVMTYLQLSEKLNKDDLSLIRAFERRMEAAVAQWEALQGDLPLASPVERAKIEANLRRMQEEDICYCLKKIIDYIEGLDIDLYDHYRHVRYICN